MSPLQALVLFSQINPHAGYCALSGRPDNAHARRRFFEAVQALPKSEQKKNTAAHEIVRRIDALYAIEREIKQLPDEERAQVRQVRAVPLLDSLHTFAQSLQTQTLISGRLG